MLENSNKVAIKIQKLKDNDINKQESILNDRIMLKKARSQEKLNKVKSLTEIQICKKT